MTYKADETSIQDSAPIELFEIVYPGGVTRYCGGYDDIAIDANGDASVETYTAAPIEGGQMPVSSIGEPQDFEVTLPISDQLVQLYGTGPIAGYGPPPQEMLWRVWRYQPISGQVEQIWKGYAAGLAFKGRKGTYRIPSGTDDALATEIPSQVLQRTCGAVLYDNRCQAVKAVFSVDTAVNIGGISGDSLSITVAAVAGAAPFHKLGLIEKLSTGEKRTITDQSGNTLKINMPFRSLLGGDAVKVSGGCDKSPKTCSLIFNNIVNFRGHAQAPLSNPFLQDIRNVQGQV